MRTNLENLKRYRYGITAAGAFLAIIPLLIASCASTPPPQVFHQTDSSALVVHTINTTVGFIVSPIQSQKLTLSEITVKARQLTERKTAVVILDNFSEPTLGPEFRDRSPAWFINLRSLGYENVIFLRGNGQMDPEGMQTLVEYN